MFRSVAILDPTEHALGTLDSIRDLICTRGGETYLDTDAGTAGETLTEAQARRTHMAARQAKKAPEQTKNSTQPKRTDSVKMRARALPPASPAETTVDVVDTSGRVTGRMVMIAADELQQLRQRARLAEHSEQPSYLQMLRDQVAAVVCGHLVQHYAAEPPNVGRGDSFDAFVASKMSRTPEFIATEAWRYADAMIEARIKGAP